VPIKSAAPSSPFPPSPRFRHKSPPSCRNISPELCRFRRRSSLIPTRSVTPHPPLLAYSSPLSLAHTLMPPFLLIRSALIKPSTTEARRRLELLQPRFPSTPGINRRPRASPHLPRVTLHPVVPSPSSWNHRSTDTVHSRAARRRRQAGTLARGEPPSHICFRPLDLDLAVHNTSLK
jgi:hypothetical protein